MSFIHIALSGKSSCKLKSKIANISSESKIARFTNISSCNKFPLCGICLEALAIEGMQANMISGFLHILFTRSYKQAIIEARKTYKKQESRITYTL